MYYKGDFRSLDQSVDPKGQKYSVCIFTQYKTSNPYPYITYGGYAQPVPGGLDRWVPEVKVPQSPINLTMTANPAIVTYEGDDTNKYKSHRLSSASISFLQSRINEDLINVFDSGTLVMILKWKNEVVEVGNRMVNTITGASISKKRIYDPATSFPDAFELYYGYDYCEYDKFCYDIEWIGFATPNMISCEYDHITDSFTLECQDALSVLQYRDVVDLNEPLMSFMDVITYYMRQLGCYKHIYVSSNIHLPGAIDPESNNSGNLLQHIMTQMQNYFDEDDEPTDQLAALDIMLNYLGITAVPWKDTIILYNADCVQAGFMHFDDYMYIPIRSDKTKWGLPGGLYALQDTQVELSNQVILNGDSFCDSGTNISSGNVFSKAKVECDEYHPNEIIPDIEDDENMVTDVPNNSAYVHFQGTGYRPGHGEPGGDDYQEEVNDWKYWIVKSYRPATEDIKCFVFNRDMASGPASHRDISWVTEGHEVTDADLQMGYYTTSHYPYWTELWQKNGCIIIDNSGFQNVATATSIPQADPWKRQYFFFNGADEWYWRKHYVGQTTYYDFDDKVNYSQKLLYIKSKPILFNGHQYLNVKGDWSFYANGSAVDVRFKMWPTNNIYGSGSAGHRKFNPKYAFIYATVKCAGKYLNTTSLTDYVWQDEPVVTKLYLRDDVVKTGEDYTGETFPFGNMVRNIDGLFFKIPVPSGQCVLDQVEIWFDRVLGPGGDLKEDVGNIQAAALCWCATLSDLEVNICADEYVNTMGKKDPGQDNTEYETVIEPDAVEEYPQINLKLSSTDRRGASYSETCIKRTVNGVDKLYIPNTVYNDATGSFGFPERGDLDGVMDQHKRPTIQLDMPLFSKVNLSPVSRIRWGHLSGKDFLINTMRINYEYEAVDVNIYEMKPNSHDHNQVIAYSATRNYYRTGDIRFDGRVSKREETPTSDISVSRYSSPVPERIDNGVHMEATTFSEGVSRFEVDFATGTLHFTTPSNISTERVGNELVMTIPDPSLRPGI